MVASKRSKESVREKIIKVLVLGGVCGGLTYGLYIFGINNFPEDSAVGGISSVLPVVGGVGIFLALVIAWDSWKEGRK